MCGTLFNEVIDSFEQALQRNGEYKLSGPVIQPIPMQYQNFPGEYQMYYTEHVKIKPINTELCSATPQYIKLAIVNQATVEDDELVDVLAVVIDVNDIRPVKKGETEQELRDITIIDDGIQHETLDLAEEKRLVREIKQLNRQREQLAGNTQRRQELQQSLDQRVEKEEHLKVCRKEMDGLTENHAKAEECFKAAKKRYDQESTLLNDLKVRFTFADDIRQEAYTRLQTLKKQAFEKTRSPI